MPCLRKQNFRWVGGAPLHSGCGSGNQRFGHSPYQQIPEEELEVSIADMDDEWASPLPCKDRQPQDVDLLDSRQDAAFFATYLQNSYEQICNAAC